MITYVVGDLFTSPAKVLVNTVNTVGVMGKGIALDFKRIYPEMFEQYQYYCESGMLDIGKLWLYKTPHKWILNFPTKKHWRSKSKTEYISEGLDKFVNTYDSKGIDSISFPMLGCGNGELDWNTEVQPLMEKYLEKLPINVFIHILPHEHYIRPEHKAIDEMKKWLREEPHALSFSEFWDDLSNVARKQHDFFTTIGNTRFSIVLLEDEDSFHLAIQDDVIVIGLDALRDFWQLVRSSGYCKGNEFPAGLNQYHQFLIPVLDQLPYVQATRLSRQYNVDATDLGIQLIPESRVFALPSIEVRQSITA